MLKSRLSSRTLPRGVLQPGRRDVLHSLPYRLTVRRPSGGGSDLRQHWVLHARRGKVTAKS